MAAVDEPVPEATVRDRLRNVYDPELDENVVDLQYVDRIAVDGGTVRVRFRLPTAWCSPAFAWMMATDVRDEVGSLAAVDDVEVRLVDHMHDEAINEGVNERRPFEAVFEDAEDDIEAVRAKLDHKARLSRQYRAVEALLDAGLSPEQIAALRREDVTVDRTEGDDGAPDAGEAVVALRDGELYVTVAADPLAEYLDKAGETGVVTSGADRLFATPDDEPIDADDFERVHARTRLAKSNMEGQGGLCASLNESRYDDVEPAESD